MHVSEAKMASLILKGQAFVIDPQKMQDGRVKVMNMNPAFGYAVGVLVRLTVGRSRLNPPPANQVEKFRG